MVLLASSYDQSKFLKAQDLTAERKFRIKSVTEELIGAGDDKEKKLVVRFTNDERGLVLNRTNNRIIRGAFGDAVEGWPGKVIAVYPTMVEFRGRMTPGLRVRIPPPKRGGKSAALAKPPPAPDPELEPEKEADDGRSLMTGDGPVGSVDFNRAVAPLMQEQCDGARHQHRQTACNTSTRSRKAAPCFGALN